MVARAGSRDDIDAPHGAAAMWADGDLGFDEGIAGVQRRSNGPASPCREPGRSVAIRRLVELGLFEC